jgi:hypothetical protein
MNPEWIAMLLQLVEGYAAERASGAAPATANLTTLASGVSLLQHVFAPSAPVAAPAATPAGQA